MISFSPKPSLATGLTPLELEHLNHAITSMVGLLLVIAFLAFAVILSIALVLLLD